MRKCRPGLMEYALEAVFLRDCYLLGGCRHAPYTPICASGPNGAVLHYGHAAAPNSARPPPRRTPARRPRPAARAPPVLCLVHDDRAATPAHDLGIGCECGWTASPGAAALKEHTLCPCICVSGLRQGLGHAVRRADWQVQSEDTMLMDMGRESRLRQG
jgi:hypothetical protein